MTGTTDISRRQMVRRCAHATGIAVAAAAAPVLRGSERVNDDATSADRPHEDARGAGLAVTAVFGSGRRGGISESACERLLAMLESHGARVRRFFLTDMRYEGCQACMTCKTSTDRCVLDDDLSEVLESIRSDGALVLASSTYFSEISSQAKAFIDRMYSYYRPEFWALDQRSRLSPDKRLVLVLAQGNADGNLFANIGPRYSGLLTSQFGFVDAGLVRCVGLLAPAEIEGHSEIVQAIEAIAGRLLVEAPRGSDSRSREATT